ncbi:TPA: phage portal protein [Escherichia coli]|nr:phage portal protein [Escherichia coli]EEZ4532690.1 phage portal protein [Escherichia coli]EEZ4955199.1 phage portal protein [Escherichia coli]EFC7460751.1 phage portal protein [Escherichia coli]EFL1867432.1 phage portal protein [Escherichia coli]
MNTTLTPADLDPRRQAMLLYFQGYRVARIAEMLGEKVATVHSWKKRDKWGDYGPLDQMQLTTAARYCQLIMKEHKEGKDFKEIDLLARQSERHARIGKFNNGGIPSALLNESATLFRRKYYINGSHAGFIMYMTDAAQNQEDVNNLRNAMKSAKGPGNFRNLFMYSPNGKKDGLQIIPLSEVAAKDEFLNIKNVSRDDMMAAHRVPPQMMGIMPNNVGGFGDVEKASRVPALNLQSDR